MEAIHCRQRWCHRPPKPQTRDLQVTDQVFRKDLSILASAALFVASRHWYHALAAPSSDPSWKGQTAPAYQPQPTPTWHDGIPEYSKRIQRWSCRPQDRSWIGQQNISKYQANPSANPFTPRTEHNNVRRLVNQSQFVPVAILAQGLRCSQTVWPLFFGLLQKAPKKSFSNGREF